MGTEIRLLLGRYMGRNAIGNERHPTTLYESLVQPTLMNVIKAN